MAVNSPARKSGRQRVPTKKYQDDIVRDLGNILSSDSEEEAAILQQEEDDVGDKEFNADAEAAEPEDEESLDGDVSDGSAIVTPVEIDEEAPLHADAARGVPVVLERDAFPAVSLINPTKRPKPRVLHETNTRSRGMIENPLKMDHTQSRLEVLAGTGKEDISHVIKSQDKWAIDPTLPHRSRLCFLMSHTEEKRTIEGTVGWNWYYGEGDEESRLKMMQQSRRLTTEQASIYRTLTFKPEHEFLFGPYGRQKLLKLSPLQTLDLSEAWTTTSRETTDHQNENQQQRNRRTRHGWIFNVGSKVRCLDWAPNHGEKVQYLALSTVQNPSPQAYEPSQPCPSVVQIWTFPEPTSQVPENMCKPSPSFLCAEWGDATQLQWCPVPRVRRDDNFVGLLAGIWADGYVRVLDVQVNEKGALSTTDDTAGLETGSNVGIGQSSIYLKMDSAGFAARPDETVCTCLTWLSATDLAVGHANGMLHIYDISPRGASTTITTVAWFSMQLHPTYVLCLISAYPSHPYLLISSSMSGYLRLTSLHAPHTDYVLSSRSRTVPSSIAYHDGLLSIVGPDEASETVRLWGLRCLYASISVAKMNSAPGPGNQVIDVGKCHASIAVGEADGSVTVTNPMRKVLGKRRQASYQQTLFKHEWVRRPSPSGQEGERLGISRFTEGYKVSAVDLSTRNFAGKVKEAGTTTTIHEEETAVTALRWNPNVECGGWLAVGWGSGLLRVQDVAID